MLKQVQHDKVKRIVIPTAAEESQKFLDKPVCPARSVQAGDKADSK
jgi:hypothetical protein